MTVEVFLIPDEVFPKSPLPYATLTPFFPTPRDALAFGNGAGEMPFEQVPARRNIGIARRQRPHAMQMAWHHHHCLHLERPPSPGIGESQTQ